MLGDGAGATLSEGGDGAGGGGAGGGAEATGASVGEGAGGGGSARRGASMAAVIRGSVGVATRSGGTVPSVGSPARTMRIRTARAVTQPEAAMTRIWAVEKPSFEGAAGRCAGVGAALPVGPVAL